MQNSSCNSDWPPSEIHSIGFLFKSLAIRGEAGGSFEPRKERLVPALLNGALIQDQDLGWGRGWVEVDGGVPVELARGCLCGPSLSGEGVEGGHCAPPFKWSLSSDCHDPL